jgi:hypothetical protein
VSFIEGVSTYHGVYSFVFVHVIVQLRLHVILFKLRHCLREPMQNLLHVYIYPYLSNILTCEFELSHIGNPISQHVYEQHDEFD